jgi:hypothetical protein
MTYRYSAFISYKRDGDYQEWVDKIFYPIVSKFFIDEYGENSTFKDVEQIPSGASVSESLKAAVIKSACMIAVLNGPYFCKSEWCTTEFAAVYNRQKLYMQGGAGLLFPVVFTRLNKRDNKQISTLWDKCPAMAKLVDDLSPLRLEEEKYFYVTNEFVNTQAHGQLRILINNWLRDNVVPAVRSSPPFQNNWSDPQYWDEPYNTLRRQLDCISLIPQPLL